ncbi:MAG: FtsX-like permease family protein [Candidatus Cloacimonetes bacterium]|jgi:putative ABC transport system permease protein|nr:FtsX-like permease family protein [Candidatus Cloacimonadota bacterium]
MFLFVLKGLLRDRSRSFFPVLIVTAGVLVTVFLIAFMSGYMESMVRQNARFDTGHLKIVTNAYAEKLSQKPYDLGFIETEAEFQQWQEDFPSIRWTPRIYFGALMDVPDAEGNTLEQGDVFGMAIDFSDPSAVSDIHLSEALVQGRIPEAAGEILLSEELFSKLQLELDSTVTLLGSTLYGAMSFRNYIISGTVSFGVHALDRGGIVTDIEDARAFLDMPGGASEYFGFLPLGVYDDDAVQEIKQEFNAKYNDEDDFSPQMLALTDQNDMGFMLRYMGFALGLITVVFILIIGIVLWNAGLLNSIRRYGEFGLRLAMGERKHHLYNWLIVEGLAIGVLGSLIGAALGMGVIQYFHVHGFDFGVFTKDTSMMVENIIYTNLELKNLLLGIIPGLVSTVLGAMLAGIGIFHRNTAKLFKELET